MPGMTGAAGMSGATGISGATGLMGETDIFGIPVTGWITTPADGLTGVNGFV
jgi:hypothetical protein